MVFVQQYNALCPWEVVTLDGLYSDQEIDAFKKYVEEADVRNRTFTNSPFKNGKVIHDEWSKLMYNRIRAQIPDTYMDRHGTEWRFMQSPQYIMYAKMEKDQKFGIHTDTGCEYDSLKNIYSKFTVLTYLNHDFVGGNTRFYDDHLMRRSQLFLKKIKLLSLISTCFIVVNKLSKAPNFG